MEGCDYMEDGVWRTISGRRIFIKKGQSLTDAMIESGKFSKTKKVIGENENYIKAKKNLEQYKEFAKEVRKMEEEINNKYMEQLQNTNDEKEIEELNKKWRNELENIRFETGFYKYEEWEKAKDLVKTVIIHNANDEVINELTNNYKFKNEDIKSMVANMLIANEPDKVLSAIKKFDDELSKEGKELSNSPYSFSSYIIPKGEQITWGYKPDNSFRISDHWNFYSQGEIHCKLTGVNHYVNDTIILAKYNAKTKTYDIIEGESVK
jgi:hypothetical protein